LMEKERLRTSERWMSFYSEFCVSLDLIGIYMVSEILKRELLTHVFIN
jgi:hypothetical protein